MGYRSPGPVRRFPSSARRLTKRGSCFSAAPPLDATSTRMAAAASRKRVLEGARRGRETHNTASCSNPLDSGGQAPAPPRAGHSRRRWVWQWSAGREMPGAGEPMPPKKPLVIVTRKLPDVIETGMMELFDAALNLDDTPMTQAQLVAAVQQGDVLVPTITDRIDAAVLAQAGPRLKLVASFGNGVDHIDLASARTRGITLTNTPAVLTQDTADLTMALLPAPSRRLSEGRRLILPGH